MALKRRRREGEWDGWGSFEGVEMNWKQFINRIVVGKMKRLSDDDGKQVRVGVNKKISQVLNHYRKFL
ncbi:hypothetical protein Phum_PHUM598290 [Pediculus humanus corporis]|uniref:Uncharacterized protein n=1 Tax=Pediculus humanus subsp. corporis TaxID=121224 RepID=E0W2W5_PEDHC|nr:uncharacterized protein Phum_PHUM598290 [Pediculus humanus corporis]EEB19971.1 hypothetical protein Phum_PHUM598290 [Pediculus humanus corporis]